MKFFTLSSTKILFVILAFLVSNTTYAQTCNTNEIGGKIYRDYNANGTIDTNESAVANIKVTAYDNNEEIVDETTSNSLGEYKLNINNGTKVRIEFTEIPSYLQSGPAGTESITTSSILTADDACTHHLALSNPAQYCDPNPGLATTCYINGDALGTGTASTSDTVVAWDYYYNGTFFTGSAPAPTKLSIAKQTGATWGVAYQKKSKNLFVGSLLKRHNGFGPLGPGGIYKIDYSNPSAPVTTNFFKIK